MGIWGTAIYGIDVYGFNISSKYLFKKRGKVLSFYKLIDKKFNKEQKQLIYEKIEFDKIFVKASIKKTFKKVK